MSIVGTSTSFSDYDPEYARIRNTLLDLNTRFPELAKGMGVAHEEALASFTVAGGLWVSAGTFPTLNVTAGTVVAPAGGVCTFPAGTLSEADGAGVVYTVYVDNDGVLSAAAQSPKNTILVLAEVVVNDEGTGFSSVTQLGYDTVYVHDDFGRLAVAGINNGRHRRWTSVYTYDSDDAELPSEIYRHAAGVMWKTSLTVDGDDVSWADTEIEPVDFLDGSGDLDEDWSAEVVRLDGSWTLDGSIVLA